MEDWEKRVNEEHRELSILIDDLSSALANGKVPLESVLLLKDQLGAMMLYQSILRKRVTKV